MRFKGEFVAARPPLGVSTPSGAPADAGPALTCPRQVEAASVRAAALQQARERIDAELASELAEYRRSRKAAALAALGSELEATTAAAASRLEALDAQVGLGEEGV
jgi:hypothetical protein